MSLFEYTAKKSPKEIISGQIEADSHAGAISKLSELGLFPIKLKETGNADLCDTTELTLSAKWLIFFTREIADLLNSQVSLINALDLIAKQTNFKKLQFITKKISEKVKEGVNFSKALNLFPNIFSPLYTNIVQSGEISGTLEKVLTRLALFYEKNSQLKSMIIEALVYPTFLLIMGFAAVIVLTVVVIPKLIPMFEDMRIGLPLITKIIVALSNMMMSFWYVIILIVVIIILIFIRILRSKTLNIKLQYILLKIPVINDFISNRHLSEIFQSLESLIDNGITTVKAIQITEISSSFHPYKNELNKIIIDITNGDSVSKSFENSKLFSSKIHTVIRVGEESGKLGTSMKKLSESYSESFGKAAGVLTKLAGPVFIIIIAGFIGVVVIAMLLPIFNLNVNF